MKQKYKVLLTMPLALAASVGGTYLLPTRLEVEHAVMLTASPEQVFEHLGNPMAWEKWSAWNRTEDPSMIYLYGGPESGIGARMQWSGDKVGNGQLIFIESTNPSSLTYLQLQESFSDSLTGTFTLSPTQSGTKLVWRQHTAFGSSPLARVRGLFQKYRKQKEIETGLEGLKTLLQNNSKTNTSNQKKAYVNYH